MNIITREQMGRLRVAMKMAAPKTIENYFYVCTTPKLIYSSQLLMNSIDRLRVDSNDVLNFKLYYSVKANLNNRILNFIGNKVDGAEVSSEYEYKLATAAGIQRIISTAPVPSESFIMRLYEKGHVFDFDSFNSIERCGRYLSSREIGIRIRTPEQWISTDTQHNGSRFGICLTEKYEVSRLVSILKENNLSICQLHYHGRVHGFEHQKQVCDYINYLLQECPMLKNISAISLGGGIDLFYSLGNSQINGFWNAISFFSRKIKRRNIKVILEPGEQIVSTCGFLVVTVMDSVFRGGRQHLTVDSSGFNLLSWQEPWPYCISMSDHCFYGNSVRCDTVIWGQTCYEEDVFIRRMYLPKMKLGDRIVFYPMGAYTATTARHLHQIPSPSEILM